MPLEAIVLKNEAPGMDSALRIQIYPKKRDFPWGWDFETIKPTIFPEESGFLGVIQSSG